MSLVELGLPAGEIDGARARCHAETRQGAAERVQLGLRGIGSSVRAQASESRRVWIKVEEIER